MEKCRWWTQAAQYNVPAVEMFCFSNVSSCKKQNWCYAGDIDQHVKELHKLVGEHCIIQHCNIFYVFSKCLTIEFDPKFCEFWIIWQCEIQIQDLIVGQRVFAFLQWQWHSPIFSHKKKNGTSSISCDKNVKRHKVDIFGFQILTVETACKIFFIVVPFCTMRTNHILQFAR